MHARRSGPALVTVVAVAMTPATALPAPAAVAAGSERDVTWADIRSTPAGYRYLSGGHHNRLTITITERGLRFRDPSVGRLTSLPASCEEIAVARGVAALCDVPDDVTAEHPLAVEVVPRRGNDRVDASSLPATVELAVLADAGADRVRTGAGDDFVNGAPGRDRVHGGDGDDWVRTGDGRDRLLGGSGNDRLVGVAAGDRLDGGPGDDAVGGGPGGDLLRGGPGADVLRCSTGTDEVFAGAEDTHSDCEVVAAERAAS